MRSPFSFKREECNLNKTFLSILQLLLVVQLVLIGLCYFQFFVRTPGQYIGQFPSNELFRINAFDRPNVSTKALLNWATLASTATFTFDFVNYENQLTSLKDYFTNDGYTNFVDSLNNNGTLAKIEEEKLIVSAVATGTAIILREELLGALRSWRIQVPVLVRYQSASVNETRRQIIEVLVTQVSTSDAPKGIGIAQYIARGAGA